MLTGAWLIDDDDRRQARIGGRRHASEHRHVAIRRIAARGCLPGGARLARYAIPGNGGELARAFRCDYGLEHADELAAQVLIKHTLSAGSRIDAQKRNRAIHAKRTDNRVGMRELQRRDRKPIAVRHRRDADRPPVRIVAQEPGGLAGKTARRDLTKAERRQCLPHELRLERQRKTRHADVGALGEHRRNIDDP